MSKKSVERRDRHRVRQIAQRAVVPVCMLMAVCGAAHADDVVGVLDPRAGILMPRALSTAATSAPNRVSGVLDFVGTLTISTGLPTKQKLYASVSVSTSDAIAQNSTSLDGTVSRSGSKGTVTLSVPYLWTVASTSDKVSVLLTASTEAKDGTFYYFSQQLVLPLPADGVTTTTKFVAGLNGQSGTAALEARAQ